MLTPEGKVKAAIKKYLKTLDGTWFYFPVQSGRGVVGIPDIVGCCCGRFFSIEVKAPGKESTVTPNQARNLDRIIAAGGLAIVASDVAHVEGMFRLMGMAKKNPGKAAGV